MAKIVISDLFGTAIPNSIEKCDYLYGKGTERRDIDSICDDKAYHTYLLNKEAEQFMYTINEYLNNGNHLFIVSNLSGHDVSSDFILDEIIERCYQHNKFNVYLVTQGGAATFRLQDLEPKISSKFVENGIQYIIYNGYKVGLLNKKTEIFRVIESQFDLTENELYCAGNMPEDIPMLLECIERGGKSTLLCANLYSSNEFNNKSLHSVIHKRASIEWKLKREKEMLNSYPNYFELEEDEAIFLRCKWILINKDVVQLYSKWMDKRIPELYEELRKGKFTKDDLIKSNFVLGFFSHAVNHYLDKKTFSQHRWDEITMASTFRDYYNSFLSDQPSVSEEELKRNLIKKETKTEQD